MNIMTSSFRILPFLQTPGFTHVAIPFKNLPILLGAIRQDGTDGELALVQNDGERRFYFVKGELVHLKSEAAGEQFGNYLLRQGILDLQALNELLANEERYRLGEKVIQWGMMTLEERDTHILALQEQIMVHALEHPVLDWTWTPGAMDQRLEQDLHFRMHHRRFVWNAFQECHYMMDLLDILDGQRDWTWEGRRDLVESMADLPLTPGTAYALSFLGADPIAFGTFRDLSALDEEEAARLVMTLWALGALTLKAEAVPTLKAAPPPAPAPEPVLEFTPGPAPDPLPLIPPPLLRPSDIRPSTGLPLILPPPRPPRATPPALDLEPLPIQPEFLDFEGEPGDGKGPSGNKRIQAPAAPPPPPPPPPAEPEPELPPQLPPTGLPLSPAGIPLASPAIPLAPAPAPPENPDRPLEAAATAIPALPPPPPVLEGPARARQLMTHARMSAQQDRTVEAVRLLEQVVQLDPDGEVAFEAWLMLGRLRSTNPAWSTRAIEALQQAARLRPRRAEPWAAMGEIYHRKGFETNAIACFKKALGLDPSVAIPKDVDLDAPAPTPAPAPAKKGLLGKFKSMLGGD